jgi:sn-glycerol 3-phosphate transport system permease protein
MARVKTLGEQLKPLTGATQEIGAPYQAVLRARAARAGLASLLYCAPALVFFALFSYVPFFKSIWLSLHVTNASGEIVRFNGLAYYTRILTTPEYLSSIGLTLQFALMVVPLSIVSGVGLAALAAVKLRHIKIFRTIFTSSIAISLASAGVIFTLFYSPVIGITRGLEQFLGLKSPGLLANADTALMAVAFMTAWSSLGFNFVICLSGIQSIPQDIYESGALDGADGWRSFLHLTLPMLAPTLLFLLVIGTIQSAQAFTQFNVLMQGAGPEGSTNVFVYSTFRMFWYENRYGFSSAMSIVLFFILFVLSLIQFRGFDDRVHYQ